MTDNTIELVLPTSLEESDQTYTAKLLADMAQVEQMQAFITKTLGARASWMEYLASKYKLTDGDAVQPDGSITRRK